MGASALPEGSMGRQSENNGGLIVVLTGLATTVATLVLVYVVAVGTEGEFDLMGLYLFFVIPAGAIGVGLGAGSGYSLASWVTGARIPMTLLGIVAVTQVLAYVGAQYVAYTIDATDPVVAEFSFLQYYDILTRQISFSTRGGNDTGALGSFGYVVRGLELFGFVAGGLIAPLWLSTQPYCADCQLYMKGRELGLLPAGIEAKKLGSKKGRELHETEAREAFEAQLRHVEHALKQAHEGNVDGAVNSIDEKKISAKDGQKLNARLELHLHYCKKCRDAAVKVSVQTGKADRQKTEELTTVQVPRPFVDRILDRT